MKNIYIIALLLCVGFAMAQRTGVNTLDPKATLDIKAMDVQSATIAEGLTIPRLTCAELQERNDLYSNDDAYAGTMVYVNEANCSENNTDRKTLDVTSKGYYVYDKVATETGYEYRWLRLDLQPFGVQQGVEITKTIYDADNVDETKTVKGGRIELKMLVSNEIRVRYRNDIRPWQEDKGRVLKMLVERRISKGKGQSEFKFNAGSASFKKKTKQSNYKPTVLNAGVDQMVIYNIADNTEDIYYRATFLIFDIGGGKKRFVYLMEKY